MTRPRHRVVILGSNIPDHDARRRRGEAADAERAAPRGPRRGMAPLRGPRREVGRGRQAAKTSFALKMQRLFSRPMCNEKIAAFKFDEILGEIRSV